MISVLSAFGYFFVHPLLLLTVVPTLFACLQSEFPIEEMEIVDD